MKLFLEIFVSAMVVDTLGSAATCTNQWPGEDTAQS